MPVLILLYVLRQVAILETGKQIMMAIGVVTEGYNTAKMPGWENGTVGYYTDGSIFDAENNYYGRPTKGIYLTIIPRARVEYEMLDSQGGA